MLYVETPGLRAPTINRRDIGKLRLLLSRFRFPALEPVGDGIWRMSTPQLPYRRWRLVRLLNERFTLWRVRRAIRFLGWKRPLLWFTVPHVPFVLGKLDERLSVYYCVDDYSSLPGVNVDQVRDMDQDLSRRADLIFAVSRRLQSAKLAMNANVVYSPHGVDVEHFANQHGGVALPAKDLRHPVVGFFGVLDERFAIDTLCELADSRPLWTILIVGRVTVDVSQLTLRSNVVLTGPVSYETLPSWAKAFDVCIMPYKPGKFAEHCNPLKLREYLATGKPVISTDLPELEDFAPYLRLARTASDFVAQIEHVLQADSASDQLTRQHAVAGTSWEARVEALIKHVEDHLTDREL